MNFSVHSFLMKLKGLDMRVSFLIIASAISALMTGCVANSVTEQGQKVVIVQSLPTQYQCTYKGEVVGSQGNWLTGGWTTNRNLALGARNDLRNEAAKLGANVVVIAETINSTDEKNSLENITHVGRAYSCR